MGTIFEYGTIAIPIANCELTRRFGFLMHQKVRKKRRKKKKLLACTIRYGWFAIASFDIYTLPRTIFATVRIVRLQRGFDMSRREKLILTLYL